MLPQRPIAQVADRSLSNSLSDSDNSDKADDGPTTLHCTSDRFVLASDFGSKVIRDGGLLQGGSTEGIQNALKDFEHDGYCRFQSFLTASHLSELRVAFDARMQQQRLDGMEVNLGLNWAEEDVEPFVRTLLDERLLDALKKICGMPFVAMRLELFEKMPGSHTIIPWHQDTYTTHVGFTWTAELAEQADHPHPVTLWVALDRASVETGGMEMVPGRHRELIGAIVPPLSILGAAAHGDVVEYRLEAGQAGLHHPLTPHRSLPNTSDHCRRAFLIRFTPWSQVLAQTCPNVNVAAASWEGPTQQRVWESKPAGRYRFVPGSEAALDAKRALNRFLVCCEVSNLHSPS
eukprot:TRINITY_DN10534_c1_g1_i1.p1 TRINITY_DN10534_c1_g1~~TRINITY_DN10534_c1_g1_i1.p1  ORF type:complete len:347 (-),score=40.83 TRINITY_DN10534_c1_g1_i1:175-1215(-)